MTYQTYYDVFYLRCSQSPGATEACVMVKYSLADQPSQNQILFSLKPAEDAG